MSVQFGQCNFDGKPICPEDFDKIRPLLAPYGPDGEGCICDQNFGILYRAFHTTQESRRAGSFASRSHPTAARTSSRHLADFRTLRRFL
jgi:hypothetical protein